MAEPMGKLRKVSERMAWAEPETRFTPCQRLWEAVLLRRCRDLSVPGLAWEAVAWVLDDDEDCGSFVYVCDALGVAASAVRQALRRGCALGSLDGSRRTDIHRLKLVGKQAGAPMRVRGMTSNRAWAEILRAS